MGDQLSGCVIAILVSDGVRRKRLEVLRDALHKRNARVQTIGLHEPPIAADDDSEIAVDVLAAEVSPGYYDGIIVAHAPNAEEIFVRDEEAIGLLQAFSEERRPLGAIGNGVALLADASVIAGCAVACPPELDDFIREAEGHPMTDAVVSDRMLTTALADTPVEEFIERFASDVIGVRTREYVDEMSNESFPASDAHSGSAAMHG